MLYRLTGAVKFSSSDNHRSANTRSSPHISSDACKPEQQAGRSGWPKMAQRRSSVSWMQGTPAGLPFGMPGIALEMEGAVQQAAHNGRQEFFLFMRAFYRTGQQGGGSLAISLSFLRLICIKEATRFGAGRTRYLFAIAPVQNEKIHLTRARLTSKNTRRPFRLRQLVAGLPAEIHRENNFRINVCSLQQDTATSHQSQLRDQLLTIIYSFFSPLNYKFDKKSTRSSITGCREILYLMKRH